MKKITNKKVVSKQTKAKSNGKYRSGFEAKVTEQLTNLGIDFEYEPQDKKVSYLIPESKHTYLPDLVIGDTIYECKGRFLSADRKKHRLLKEQHPEQKIVIVFQNPNVPITKGSKTKYRDWCDKNKISWCTVKDLPRLLKGA